MEFDEVKDSGTRETWSTGSRRQGQEGRGLHYLIPKYPKDRLAVHYENGAKVYGLSNWKKGQPLSQYLTSMERHVDSLKEGMHDEDHAAAIAWNAFSFMWTAHEIEEGRLPAVLDNLHDSGGFTSAYDKSLFDEKGFPLPPVIDAGDGLDTTPSPFGSAMPGGGDFVSPHRTLGGRILSEAVSPA